MAEVIYNFLGRMRERISFHLYQPSLVGVGNFKYRVGVEVMLREKRKAVLHFWGGRTLILRRRKLGYM